MAALRLQEIIVGSKDKSKEIGKLEKEGLIKKIAPRLYTSNMAEASEIIVRRNWYRILSELYPEAFLSHRSALERMPTKGVIGVKYATDRVGPFTKTVTIKSNAVGQETKVVTIKGTVLPDAPADSAAPTKS